MAHDGTLAPAKETVLDMRAMDYFTKERIGRYAPNASMALRTHNRLREVVSDLDANTDEVTLRRFVEEYSCFELRRFPNFGIKTLAITVACLAESGLELRKF